MRFVTALGCAAFAACTAHAEEACVDHSSEHYNDSLSRLLATKGVRNSVRPGSGVCFDATNDSKVRAAQGELELYYYQVADILQNSCDEASVVAWARKENLPFDVQDALGSNGRVRDRLITIFSISSAEVTSHRSKLAQAPRVRKCLAKEVAPEVDREVLDVVLKHFAARSDAHFYDLDGKLLVWPQTASSKGISVYSNLEASEGECPAPRRLYEGLNERNTLPRSAAAVLSQSDEWRLVKGSEEKTIWPTFPAPPDAPKRPPTKTVITLYLPGYSDSGDTALVLFHFVWSMHGAAARYVLQREGPRWEIKCSKLVFYV